MKYVCNACGHPFPSAAAHLQLRAIDSDIPIVGCPQCKVNDQVRWACDNPGCWDSPIVARADGNFCGAHQ